MFSELKRVSFNYIIIKVKKLLPCLNCPNLLYHAAPATVGCQALAECGPGSFFRERSIGVGKSRSHLQRLVAMSSLSYVVYKSYNSHSIVM